MEKGKAVRLLDVARHAGVGVGTASRVLNHEPGVSEEKRQRVLRAIEELDYRRNAIARSLKVNRTKTLGVVIPDIANEFYCEIVRGAEDAARSEHYNIILCSTDSRPVQEINTITMLAEKQVNIATLQLYRDKRGGYAVMVIETDQEVPEESVTWLEQLDGIIKVTYINVEE